MTEIKKNREIEREEESTGVRNNKTNLKEIERKRENKTELEKLERE